MSVAQTYGKIQSIEVISQVGVEPVAPKDGSKGAQMGLGQMINALFGGYSSMDGYRVTTDAHTFFVLIDNQQSCCESWGYMASEDDFAPFIGTELREINLTDTALNQAKFGPSHAGLFEYGFDSGGVQFVDFVTNQGTFQLAVYNDHNGYYGHGILVTKDDEIILSDTL